MSQNIKSVDLDESLPNTLSPEETLKVKELMKTFMGNKQSWIDKYGLEQANFVMYKTAVKKAKETTLTMENNKLREMIKDSLKDKKKNYANLSPKERKEVGIQYDYEDIGQFYLEGLNKSHNLTDEELGILGKKVVNQLYKGDIGVAYDDIVFTKRGKEKFLKELDSSDQSTSEHTVKYSKSNDTYQVWLGDEIVTDFATKERADAESKRLNLLQSVKDVDKAQVDEDLDLGHEDNEPHMLKSDLYRIGKYAMELYKMVDGFENGDEVDFPHWWQAKIIKSKDMLVSAKHYLDFELNEPQIDAMVDVASEEEAIEEIDRNDPVMMKMRATKDQKSDFGKAYGDAVKTAYGNDKNAKKLAFLKKEKEQLMRDMEQEAEPEGGPIADEYGSKLNRIDAAIAKLSGRKEMTYDQAIAEGGYRVEYKTEDGEKAKSRVFDKKEDADKKEKQLVDKGIKQVEIVKLSGRKEMTYDQAISEGFKDYLGYSSPEIPRPTQDQVDKFFALTQNEMHYLNSKPVEGQEKTFNNMEVEPWDEYDLSNWNSLIRKSKQRGKSLDEDQSYASTFGGSSKKLDGREIKIELKKRGYDTPNTGIWNRILVTKDGKRVGMINTDESSYMKDGKMYKWKGTPDFIDHIESLK